MARKKITLLALVAAVSGLVLTSTPALAANGKPVERQHTVTTVPAEGEFTCGDLTLSIDGGTETEIFHGVLKEDGVATIRITRLWRGVTLTGSDGNFYRATAHTRATFVLVAPDFDNPVSGREVIKVKFFGGPAGSPGFIQEEINIRNGTETDTVSGPCEFSD